MRNLLNKGPAREIIAAVAASLVLLLSLWYVYLNQDFDATTLLAGVLLPLVLGSAILYVTKERVLLFAFLAYFWSLVDDKPVQFDSVLTWPEVTRFHPATPHIFMEVVLHVLTIAFLYLAVREGLKGTALTQAKALKVSLLTLAAFVLSYAQNIPLDALQTFVTQDWYALDLVEHVVSLAFLYLALREAARGPVYPQGDDGALASTPLGPQTPKSYGRSSQ
jgi:hypothetical protein